MDAKKKTYGYRERDEAKRAAFLAPLAAILPSQRVYIDESGMDEHDDYGYGWSHRGQRLAALKAGRRSGRVNMIAAYCQQRLMAPFTVEGACIELRSAKGVRVVFETWLETCLIPALQPGQVVIGANATCHHGGRIVALIAAAGCCLLYLPPYSPDFNRIKKCWAWLKSRIRKRLSYADSLRQAMESVLKDAVS